MVECWNKWITDTLPFTRDNDVTTVELQSLSSRVWKISCSPDSRPKYVTSQPCMHPCIHACMQLPTIHVLVFQFILLVFSPWHQIVMATIGHPIVASANNFLVPAHNTRSHLSECPNKQLWCSSASEAS